jgi:hypothetical protein
MKQKNRNILQKIVWVVSGDEKMKSLRFMGRSTEASESPVYKGREAL